MCACCLSPPHNPAPAGADPPPPSPQDLMSDASTVNWCESDYVWSPHIAEWWNTISRSVCVRDWRCRARGRGGGRARYSNGQHSYRRPAACWRALSAHVCVCPRILSDVGIPLGGCLAVRGCLGSELRRASCTAQSRLNLDAVTFLRENVCVCVRAALAWSSRGSSACLHTRGRSADSSKNVCV